ncbi:MAG: DUF2065 domain-containing protein [Pseudomonadota bacterium]|nr:DUF2065 domain-containing protein [Pseudomonadota bacterium]
MTDLWTALALILVIEGTLYCLFPTTMRRALTRVMDASDNHLRTLGLAAAVVGAGLVWLIRG